METEAAAAQGVEEPTKGGDGGSNRNRWQGACERKWRWMDYQKVAMEAAAADVAISM